MTVIQNTETSPDGTPIAGVLVQVRTFGSTPAAMATGTGSVVGTAEARSDSSGHWSLDLTPTQDIKPDGTCYIFKRTYPPTIHSDGYRSTEAGIVPPSSSPIEYTQIVVSSPTALPFTDSELWYHLQDADPHPQYLTQDEADALYASGGTGGGGSTPSSRPHTFISDWDTALANKSLSSFGQPTSDLSMGGRKITQVASGLASTDAANIQDAEDAAASAVSGHTSASDPHPQYLTQSEGDARYLTRTTADSLYNPTAWQDFTPVFPGASVVPASSADNFARYRLDGTTVYMQVDWQVQVNATGVNGIVFNLPKPLMAGTSGEVSASGLIEGGADVAFNVLLVGSGTTSDHVAITTVGGSAMADHTPLYILVNATYETTAGGSTGGGGSGGGSFPTSEPHTFISDWDTALNGRSLSSFALPSASINMNGQKLTNLPAATAASDAVNLGQLNATLTATITSKTADYTAAPGDFVVMDSSGGTRTVTLPSPAANQRPIWVEQSGANTVSVFGNVKGAAGTAVPIGVSGGVLCFISSASTWRIASANFPLSIFARLDQDNDFGGHVLKNYADDQISYSAATATMGNQIPWGCARQLTASGGCTVTVPASAPKIGAWVVLGQGSTSQSTIQVATGGYIVGSGGRASPVKTLDQNSRIFLECIDATPGASGYIVTGGMA